MSIKLKNKIKLTDSIDIDMDFLPLDVIFDFVETYNENIDNILTKNPVLESMRLTRVMDKTNLLGKIIDWATPGDSEKTIKLVKTKYRINIYLNILARMDEYITLTNVEA